MLYLQAAPSHLSRSYIKQARLSSSSTYIIRTSCHQGKMGSGLGRSFRCLLLLVILKPGWRSPASCLSLCLPRQFSGKILVCSRWVVQPAWSPGHWRRQDRRRRGCAVRSVGSTLWMYGCLWLPAARRRSTFGAVLP